MPAKTKDSKPILKAASKSKESMGNIGSPEGLLMLSVAATLDFIGFILFCFCWLGIDDYGILDILGMIIIGGWLFLRKGTGSALEAGKRGFKRFSIASLIEMIPFFGGISPSWTILVWKELKN